MRVLFVSHYSGLGGAQKSLLSLIDFLRPMKVECLVLIPHHGPVEGELKKRGVPYMIAKYASMRKPSKGRLRDLITGLLRKYLNKINAKRLSFDLKNKFDIIHANSSLAFFGNDLKKELKIPLVWHLREFGDIDYPLSFIGGLSYSRNSYQNADALVAISESVRQHYISNVVPKGKYQLIYNGVDESNIPPKLDYHDSVQQLKVCIVGGITEGKNHADIVNAMSLIPKGLIHLDVIGGGDPETKANLIKLAEIKNVLSEISFIGQDDNITSKLSTYDVGLVTSKNEAFGRIIIEYMMAGIGVIASDSGACPELISDGVNGLLYKLGNPSDLAEKLMKVYKSPELLKQLSLNGHKTAMIDYTAKKNAEKIFTLYNSLTRSR